MLPELKSYFTPWKRPLSPKPHWKKMLLVESGQLPALALMARLQLKLQNTIWNNCLMPKSGSPMPTDPTSSKGEHVFAVGTHAYNTYKRLAVCIHTDRHIFTHPNTNGTNSLIPLPSLSDQEWAGYYYSGFPTCHCSSMLLCKNRSFLLFDLRYHTAQDAPC